MLKISFMHLFKLLLDLCPFLVNVLNLCFYFQFEPTCEWSSKQEIVTDTSESESQPGTSSDLQERRTSAGLSTPINVRNWTILEDALNVFFMLRAHFIHRRYFKFSEKNHAHSKSCALLGNRKKKGPHRARFCAKKWQSCQFWIGRNTRFWTEKLFFGLVNIQNSPFDEYK